MREECRVCGNLLVMPSGPTDSKLLLVGAYPGWEEVQAGRPWVGRAGDVLKAELRRVGISIKRVRLTNFWGHFQPSEKADTFKEEFDFHYARLVNEIKGKKSVLLMGAYPVRMLTGMNVTDCEGTIVKPIMPLPEVDIMFAMRNPASVLTKDGAVVGEVRHSIERWSELTKEWR